MRVVWLAFAAMVALSWYLAGDMAARYRIVFMEGTSDVDAATYRRALARLREQDRFAVQIGVDGTITSAVVLAFSWLIVGLRGRKGPRTHARSA